MANVNRTVTGIKEEKLALWVVVEQLKDTDHREGCIVGSGRATEGYRP
jgi:hypothetical protein